MVLPHAMSIALVVERFSWICVYRWACWMQSEGPVLLPGSGGGIAVQPAVMQAFVECRQVSVGMQTAHSVLMLPASAAVSAVFLHGVSRYGWDVDYAHLP